MQSRRSCLKSADRAYGDRCGWEQIEPRLAPTPVLAQGFQQSSTQRQIAILAALAFHHPDDHALTIVVADLEMGEFAASHAGGVVRVVLNWTEELKQLAPVRKQP